MELCLFEKRDSMGIITLNRPKKLNALSSQLLREFEENFELACKDPDVRVIVIRAEGRAFTAGFDLKESMENNITDIVDRRADTQGEVDFFMKMWYAPKPIISAVQGYCIGGGLTISFMSDMIVASEDATFGNPEIILGFIPEIPVEFWKMPMNKVNEWLYEGKYYTAEELREIGAVNYVVPREELDAKAFEIAGRIAKIPPESMAMMKHSIRKMYDIRGFANSMAFATEMFNLARCNVQQKEMSSFKASIDQGGLKSALSERY